MDNDPAASPSHRVRRPWLYPAFATVILFVGGVAINLASNDLKEFLKPYWPYSWIVWLIFFITLFITAFLAIRDSRHREGGLPTLPSQNIQRAERDVRWYQRRPQILWISPAVLGIILGCVVLLYQLVTAPSRISEYVGALHIPRVGHFAVKLLDGKVLIIGGNLRGQRLTSTEIFDPGQSKFSPSATLAIGRNNNGAILLRDGKVFVAGDNGRPERAEVYDPTKNLFTLTQDPTGSQHNSSFSVTLLDDGRVLLIGSGQSCCDHKTEIYDPSSDSFHPSFDLLAKRLGGHTATRLLLRDDDPDKILIAGGSLSGPNRPFAKTAEIISPKTGTVLTGDLSEARRSHTATRLPSGKVVIIGGISTERDIPLPTAEVFDPRLGYFRVVGHMKVPRWGHTATLLSDGSVMIVGGYTKRGGAVTNLIERYYTVNGDDEFRSIGRLRQARASHTATLLDDGTILVVGGRKNHDNNETNILKSAEILRIF